jgi:hypothetical protein
MTDGEEEAFMLPAGEFWLRAIEKDSRVLDKANIAVCLYGPISATLFGKIKVFEPNEKKSE